MARIALFVIVVAGLAYWAISVLATRLFNASMSPVAAISVSVIVAVVLWTLLMLRFSDRLGHKDDEQR
ncbi:MAG: hypothetical protein P8Y10_13465 [Gemmatimonadales bacterium]